MQIIPYDARYKQAFIQFNTDWITEHFGGLEPEDYEIFSHIEDEIKNGSMIFFGVENDTALATCMAKPLENDTWEICKLGSNKKVPHAGCGSAVFKAAHDWAAAHGAKRIFLISNSKLKPALHIYEKYGFHEVILDDYEFDRGDIAFEKFIS